MFFNDLIIIPDPCTGNDCFDVNAEDQCRNNGNDECSCYDPTLKIGGEDGDCQGEL